VINERRWPPAPNKTEVALLLDAAQSQVWTDGPYTALVERHMQAITGAPHAVAFNSCTSAIHAALLALGAGRGSTIAVPALTFAGTVTGAGHIGARLAFTDVHPGMLTMPYTPVDATLVLPVDLHGVPHGVPRTFDQGRPVLTDSCQALGSRIGGRHIGWEGTHAWSFSSAKLVAAPDGGAVTTDDPALAGRLRELRDYGLPPGGARANGRVVHPLGHNWRPSELSMALVSHRLADLTALVARANRAAEVLHGAIDRAGHWRQQPLDGTQPAWHKVRMAAWGWNPDRTARLDRALNDAGVPTHRWGTAPLHTHPAYRVTGRTFPKDYEYLPDGPSFGLDIAEQAGRVHFCLGTETCPPMSWTDQELDLAAAAIEATKE
jgi:perosamine synthetase